MDIYLKAFEATRDFLLLLWGGAAAIFIYVVLPIFVFLLVSAILSGLFSALGKKEQ